MNIHPINAFSDNYIWCIEQQNDIVVVDPGEAKAVLAYIEQQQLQLTAILLTHMHADHTGGVRELVARYPETAVYGPEETKDLVTTVVTEGDTFTLFGQTVEVYKSGGHTDGHVSFLMDDQLFCGDALFSAGCGRVFTGDYEAQYGTLQKFKHLNEDVQVYAGHEYTETNLRFANEVQPDNEKLSKALEEVQAVRAEGRPTLPSTIGREKEINLFMQAETLEDFIELRNVRDNF